MANGKNKSQKINLKYIPKKINKSKFKTEDAAGLKIGYYLLFVFWCFLEF